MKTISVLLVLLVLVMAACGQNPVTYTRNNAVPATYFGMHINYADGGPDSVGSTHGTSAWPPFSFGTYRTWDKVNWSTINTSAGVYNWTVLDNYVALMQSHGVQNIVLTLGNTPTWASSNPTDATCAVTGGCDNPASLTNWIAWVTAAVQHYCGKIAYYEIWNEPNLPRFWSGTTAQMVTLAAAAYPIIHSTSNCAVSGKNPNFVLSPPQSNIGGPTWTQGFLASGGGQYIDILAYHGYGYTTQLTESFTGDLAALKSAVFGSAAVAKTLPVWNTEYSWNQNTELPALTDQIAFLGRSYLTQWATGVDASIWYVYDGGLYGQLCGGLNGDGSWSWPTPSCATGGPNSTAYAYGYLYQWMMGATESCTRYSDLTWVCTLSRSGNYTGYAVWNANGAGSWIVPSGVVQYRDLAGNKTSTTAGTQITLATSPLLFETKDAW